MGDMFRSEPMVYVQINVSNSAAHDTVRALGNYGKLHIEDLSDSITTSKEAMSLKKKVLECSEWSKKLDFVEERMAEFKVDVPHVFPVEYKQLDVLDGVKHFLDPHMADLRRHIEFQRRTKAAVFAMRERAHVLKVCHEQLHGGGALARSVAEADEEEEVHGDLEDSFVLDFEAKNGDSQVMSPLATDRDRDGGRDKRIHNYLAGVIPVVQQLPFERMVFRVTRGNSMVRFFQLAEPVTDPETGENIRKSVFCVVSIGQRPFEKVKQIAPFFYANVYSLPESSAEYDSVLRQCREAIEQDSEVLLHSRQEIVTILSEIAYKPTEGTSPLRDWQVALKKEAVIYNAMIKAHHYITYMTFEGWIPQDDVAVLDNVLKEAVVHSGGPAAALIVAPDKPLKDITAPPTYFKTNKVTANFQAIVDTYGVPRYQEVNPALFTIVTFPFLFGVMYGDIGHGTVVTLFALYLIWNERGLAIQQRQKTMGEIFGMAFSGRYVLFAMGLCAVYCGFIYNDLLSLPLELFGSRWKFDPTTHKATGKPTSVYPLGVDPAWYHTTNELIFFNSLKMKISVIIGVTQMTFGIILAFLNHHHDGDVVGLFLECIPQLLFMLCTFGYMIFIVLYKWCIDWGANGREPPNLIQTMIGMFLSPGVVDPKVQLYPGQAGLQLFFVIVAFLCVPVMMFGKPLWLRWQHSGNATHGGQRYNALDTESDTDEKHDGLGLSLYDDDEDEDDVDERTPLTPQEDLRRSHSSDDGKSRGSSRSTPRVGRKKGKKVEAFNYGEEQIHQMIHTIEFVLGAVSNTASYLRLWALSLAHAELSTVFWEKLLVEYGLRTGNPILIVISFATWAGATFAVLLVMDLLECFLHALRLHWVEFQNKFFYADGYAFLPFTFERVMDGLPVALEHEP